MAIYPHAIQKLIPPGPNDPVITVVGTVAHVAVSEADSLYGYFNGPSGGVESHFYVRYDGTVEQYRDTRYEADAQSEGNSWLVDGKRYGYVSYETEGMGDGTWTDAQLASIKELITWVNVTHGSPWVKVPAFNKPGHGYHSLYLGWNPDKHSCPGPNRITQFNTIIVPWLVAGGKVVDMPLTDDDARKVASATLGAQLGRATIETGADLTVGIALSRLYGSLATSQAQITALTSAVQTLAETKSVDPEVIKATVAAAAEAALADLKITLSSE